MAVGVWDVVLYAAAIVAAASILTPVIMVSLRLSWLAVDVVPEVGAEPKGDDPDYLRRYRQFAELGFQPAGATRETCWFIAAFHWHWRSHDYQRWMTAPDGQTLVVLYRMVAVEPLRFSISTVFEGGAVVRTTCPGAGIACETERYLRVEYQNLEPAELLARHRQHAQAFAQSGGRAIKACTFAEAANAEVVHDHELLKSGSPRRRGVPDVLLLLAAPSLLAFQFLPMQGSTLHRGAIALVIGAMVYAGVRFLYLPKVIAQNALRTHAPSAPQQPPAAGVGRNPS